MNIEDLSSFSEDELRNKANTCLKDFDAASAMTREYLLTESQFYLAEIERRKQAAERDESAKIAKRDYTLELWVIVLIGAELVLAVVAIVVGWVEGAKQTKVLDELNRSSAATAVTLTAVRQAQEASLATQKTTLDNIVAMNDALQDEMDLNLTDAIQWGGGTSGVGHEQVNFANNARAVLSIWGSKWGNEPTTMRPRPEVLTPGSSTPFDISDLIAKTIKAMGTSTETTIPFELYLKRGNGTKYVAKGTVQVNRNNNVNYIGRMTTTRKQW